MQDINRNTGWRKDKDREKEGERKREGGKKKEMILSYGM